MLCLKKPGKPRKKEKKEKAVLSTFSDNDLKNQLEICISDQIYNHRMHTWYCLTQWNCTQKQNGQETSKDFANQEVGKLIQEYYTQLAVMRYFHSETMSAIKLDKIKTSLFSENIPDYCNLPLRNGLLNKYFLKSKIQILKHIYWNLIFKECHIIFWGMWMTIWVKWRTNQMRDIRIYKLTQNIIFDIKSMRIKSMREGEENMIYPSLLTSVY